MNAVGNASGIRRALLGILLVLMVGPACDSGGGMDNGDDNSPPNASVTANTTDPVVGDTVALDASKSDDPDGDELSFSWTLETPNGSDATLSSPTAARPWYVPDTSGDYRAEVAVSDSKLSDTDDVSMEALEKLPERVSVPFENIAADGDSLVAKTITWRDSVVTETKQSGTATIPAARESGAFCAQEGDLFAEDCISLTPTGDYTKTQTLRVDRKEVSVSVGLDLPYGSADETDVVVFEPFGADSTTFTGENSLTLPKRSESLNRRLEADLVTEEPDRSDHVDRLVADTTVSAHASAERTLQPSLVPACKDGIDSDPNDELVDVWEDTNGDGRPSEGDAGDPGCTNPDDDNEGHSIIISSSSGNDADQWVANTEGEREEFIGGGSDPLDESLHDAIEGILLGQDFKRNTSESCEGFTMKLKTGPENNLDTVNITSIKEDMDTLDGRATAEWTIPKSWFASGLDYENIALHASSSELGADQIDYPSDCLGRVDFMIKEGDEFWSTIISWAVEEEDFDGFENSAEKASTHRELKTENKPYPGW